MCSSNFIIIGSPGGALDCSTLYDRKMFLGKKSCSSVNLFSYVWKLKFLSSFLSFISCFVSFRKPEYRYHVKHVTFSDYRVKQEIPIINSEGSVCERLVNKRYATRLEFSQRGKIGVCLLLYSFFFLYLRSAMLITAITVRLKFRLL